MQIPNRYRGLMLEALEDLMYKISLDLDKMKGQPMTRERRLLTRQQQDVEELQHLITIAS